MLNKEKHYPQFPLYIPTKGRSQYMHTSRALSGMGIEHYLVVEKDQIPDYQEAIDRLGVLATIVELDTKFQDEYETLDDLGNTRSKGPGPARNFAWQHSIDNGFSHHWVMDDNIHWFYRYTDNKKVGCRSPALFRAMEDFSNRFKNVMMSGPNYMSFVPANYFFPPFVKNTRIYSCNFIRNDIPFRWRGRYNEDTILSLDIITSGNCTIQYNSFLQDKMVTQSLKGGNTEEFYHKEGEVEVTGEYAIGGTDAKSQMLQDVYPKYAKVVHKFGRTHHQVNYRQFQNPLIFRDDFIQPEGNDEYGMVLRDVDHYRNGW